MGDGEEVIAFVCGDGFEGGSFGVDEVDGDSCAGGGAGDASVCGNRGGGEVAWCGKG